MGGGLTIFIYICLADSGVPHLGGLLFELAPNLLGLVCGGARGNADFEAKHISLGLLLSQ